MPPLPGTIPGVPPSVAPLRPEAIPTPPISSPGVAPPTLPGPPPAVSMPGVAMPQDPSALADMPISDLPVLRIAIADGSAFMRSVLGDTFASCGIEVIAWSSAAEVLQQTATLVPSLLLIDTNLPDLSGELTCQQLKAIPSTQAIPVALMGTQPPQELQQIAHRARAQAILAKPFSPQEISNWFYGHSRILFGMDLRLEDYRAQLEATKPPPAPEIDPLPVLDPDELDRLLGELKDPNAGIRMEACYQLSEARALEAVEPLVELLFDGNDEVRAEAAHALGMIGSSNAIPDLIPLLSYRNQLVRERAAEALGNIGDPIALTPLSQVLRSNDRDMTILAIKAIVKIGDMQAMPMIEKLVSHRDTEISANASWAIREMTGAN